MLEWLDWLAGVNRCRFRLSTTSFNLTNQLHVVHRSQKTYRDLFLQGHQCQITLLDVVHFSPLQDNPSSKIPSIWLYGRPILDVGHFAAFPVPRISPSVAHEHLSAREGITRTRIAVV
ncbi:hypothetical protein PM082_007530 [Marasmius tenuissimus]|nr:hypothetical protein PM082_007530 [Marasmius tenuissimus]